MMNIENIINDVVLLVLDNHKPLAELGITQNTVFTKILGYDEYGVWAEHPKFKIPKQPVKPATGRKKQAYQTVTASILIPWGFIASVVHFPGVEGFDFPSPFERHIGFDLEIE